MSTLDQSWTQIYDQNEYTISRFLSTVVLQGQKTQFRHLSNGVRRDLSPLRATNRKFWEREWLERKTLIFVQIFTCPKCQGQKHRRVRPDSNPELVSVERQLVTKSCHGTYRLRSNMIKNQFHFFEKSHGFDHRELYYTTTR